MGYSTIAINNLRDRLELAILRWSLVLWKRPMRRGEYIFHPGWERMDRATAFRDKSFIAARALNDIINFNITVHATTPAAFRDEANQLLMTMQDMAIEAKNKMDQII